MPFVLRVVAGLHTERLAGPEDRHLRHRVGVFGERGHDRVAGFVDRDAVLLVGQERLYHQSRCG